MAITYPKSFADLHRKITLLTTPPANLAALTETELTAGIEASCRVTKENTRLSATASETVEDSSVCEPNGSSVPGQSNYEATLGVFRFFDETTPGAADPLGDEVFQLVKVKGTPIYVVERHVNKKWDEPWAAGDEYSVFSVTTDNWQRPTDQHVGYIKVTVPLFVTDAELNGVVATAGV